jgi:SAM-dependent methyltransferase
MTTTSGADYVAYPKTLHPRDFWRQVRRTVNGEPVDDGQIELIVESIRENLELQAFDVVADIACGNGALSHYLFPSCASLYGTDRSEYLIDVALSNFARPPAYCFAVADAGSFASDEQKPERFTKALCYGSFSYFPPVTARTLLAGLARRFPNLERVLVGNLPDRERSANAFPVAPDPEHLEDYDSPIGVWRSEEQMASLAAECGWRARFTRMPSAFYASHYRYDAVLERP